MIGSNPFVDWFAKEGWKFSSVGGTYRFIDFLYSNRNRSLEDNTISDWLYGEWDEEKLRKFQIYHNIPLVGNYLDYLLDVRADREYLKRYGLDYSDIHDPRKLYSMSSGSRLISSAYNFIGKNVDDLYKD